MSQKAGSSKRQNARSTVDDSEQKASKSTQSTGSGSEKQGGSGSGKTSGQEAKPVMAADMQAAAGNLAGTVRQQAASPFGSQKDRLAGRLGTVADALHSAGDEVRDKNDEMMAGYLDSAADRVGEMASALRDQDAAGMVRSVERFGREQPGILLAATFGLGFAAARFLKSSAQSSARSQGSWTGGSWDRSPQRGLGRFDVGDYSAAYAAGVGSGYPAAYGASGSSAGSYGSAGYESFGAGSFERDRSPGPGGGASAGWTVSGFDLGPEGQ